MTHVAETPAADDTGIATQGTEKRDQPLKMDELRKEEEAFQDALKRMNQKMGDISKMVDQREKQF